MRLKSLKLAGFKSFANPTTFSFKHGITAIVGPNGCGKSNVIDAIRWVLGETSAKQLRGGAMSDVIFAGTDGKAGKSLASVELTFEHTQDEKTGIRHPLNLYQELTLRRQVTADGKSDYFINGQRVRRRDVVDVFLGTGLGARSYAVIEQGMIGRIIDADGNRLREFIEEGAGVSRYQARREETEKQLTRARENLERLSDLQGELQKQHKTLQRQAESAHRHQDLSKKLQTIEEQILTHRLFDAWQEHGKFSKDQSTLTSALAVLNQEMQSIKTRWDGAAAKLGELQWQKDDALTKQHAVTLAHQSAQNALSYAQNEFDKTETALTKGESELSRLMSDAGGQDEKKAEHTAHIAQLTDELDHAKNELQLLELKLSDSQNNWQQVRRELSELYQEKQQVDNALSLATAGLERVRASLSKHETRQAELTQKQAVSEGDLAEKIRESMAKMQSFKNQLQALEELSSEETPELARLSQAMETEAALLRQEEKAHDKLVSEYDTLHKLVYPPKTAKVENTPKQAATLPPLPAIKDTLTLTDAGKAYTEHLDTFLGFLLGDGVGDLSELALAMHQPMSQTSDTQAVWLKSKGGELASLPAHFVRLSGFIKSPKLALWEKVAVVDEAWFVQNGHDDTQALNNHLDWQTLHAQGVSVVATSTGWLLSEAGAVPVSKLGAKGNAFLSQRLAHLERLAVLEDELSALEMQLDHRTSALKKLTQAHESLKLAHEERVAQMRILSQRLANEKTEHTALTLKEESLKKEQAWLETEKNRLALDKKELSEEEELLTTKLATAKQKQSELLPTINQVKAQSDSLNQEQLMLGERLRHAEGRVQAVTLELQSHRQALSHLEILQKTAQETKSRLGDEQARLLAVLETLEKQLPSLKAEESRLATEVHECTVATEGFDTLLKSLQAEQSTLQNERTAKQESIDEAHANLARVGAEVAVALARVQDLGEQLSARVAGFNLSARLADFAHTNFQLAGNLDALATEQKRLSSEISKLGAVNLSAAAELAELEERLSPMLKEIEDVQASISTLENAISTINQKTKVLFLDTLKSVNDELSVLFSKVFGGGQASLTLMDDETLSKADKWRAGLVLMAQPKGKKNSRLAVLSGGEKTLTALCLIFAIFKQNPAPFCVLDEVDAPLDDANVGRFTGLIGELASEVQFIFISHNKLAMQTAHELKGVTMPTAGISALVSVNLDEAMAMVG
ncbi:MAG: chromosome segregation protein SMC [Moraxella sp.]|nr:chromosome segregation protein SMC [Moraxella sp.]